MWTPDLTDSANALELTGELTLATVADWHQRLQAARRHGELPERIDLSGVDRADTSALALLLEIESWARAAGTSIRWTSPPHALRVLADLTQAAELLNWTNEDSAS